MNRFSWALSESSAIYILLSIIPNCTPNPGMVMSERMKWVSRIAHIGEMEIHPEFWS